MAPKFGLDDGSISNFDATVVLATMLTSQLREANSSEPPQAATAMPGQAVAGTGSQAQQERCRANVSEHPSDHTRIWSELSGTFIVFFSGDNKMLNQKLIYSISLQEVQQEVVVVLKADRFKGKEMWVLVNRGKSKG